MSKIKLPSTLAVLAAQAICAAAWECYTICDRERGNTFSRTIQKLGEGQPFIIFMCGMLMGHLWRRQLRVFLPGLVAGVLFWPLVDKEDLQTA